MAFSAERKEYFLEVQEILESRVSELYFERNGGGRKLKRWNLPGWNRNENFYLSEKVQWKYCIWSH